PSSTPSPALSNQLPLLPMRTLATPLRSLPALHLHHCYENPCTQPSLQALCCTLSVATLAPSTQVSSSDSQPHTLSRNLPLALPRRRCSVGAGPLACPPSIGTVYCCLSLSRCSTLELLLKKEKAHDMDINSVQWSPG
ncbi:hypothetical protein S245_055540, partial [Arachis hypogaea]